MKQAVLLLFAVLFAAGISGCTQPTGKSTNGSGQKAGSTATETVTYYVAADEVEWNYAPSGKNVVTNKPFGETENVFVKPGGGFVGATYKKALYREYTDDTFQTLKPIPAEWKHLGMVGPVIRAEVGDTIKVVFKNKATRPYSVHPHGVFYKKDSEGAPYDDGTSGSDKADEAVEPGKTHTYTWEVPERAGPGEMDPSSIIWAYHSHVDETMDTNAGLLGPMIITRDGEAGPDGRPKDVDREFVQLFTVTNENSSFYLDENTAKYAGGVTADPDEFEESNLMHNINGFVYGNGPLADLTMKKGERVRWYMIGLGTEVDLHTPHWHGNTVLWQGMRSDMIELLPMSMKTVDMMPDATGIWLYHCHVNDHLDAGMITRFNVTE